MDSSFFRTPWTALRITLWLLLGGTLAAAQLSAQTTAPHLTPRTPAERQQQYEAQRRITLAAVVTDAAGAILPGLTQADFTLTENGKRKEILSFQEVRGFDAERVHGTIVIDAINNGDPGVKRQVKQIREFLAAQKRLPFPLTISAASEGGLLEGDASTDPTVLRHDLDVRATEIRGNNCDIVAPGNDLQSRMESGIPVTAQGAAGLTRADCRQRHFLESMNALQQLFAEQANSRGRALVLWLGPGWPLPKSHDSGLVTGGNAPSDAGTMAVTLLSEIREGQVTFSGASWAEFERAQGLRRKDSAANIDAASRSEQEAMLTIPAFAEESGGLAFAKSKDLARAMERWISDAQSFYTLSFDPAAATKPDDLRVLQVKVDRPGATVRTLRFYFEQPD